MQELIDWAKSLQYNQQQCIDWIVIKDKAEQLLEKEKIKQETLEEAAEKYANDWEEIHTKLDPENITPIEVSKIDFIEGAKWQEERSYSELEVLVLLHQRDKHSMDKSLTFSSWQTPKEWFEQFKKKK